MTSSSTKPEGGRLGVADRAAGLRPQPPAASSRSSIPDAAVAELADWLALDASDPRLSGHINDALMACEMFIGNVPIEREFTQDIAGGGWERLIHAPVTVVEAKQEHTIDANGVAWVRADHEETVAYRAGMAADWSALPESLRHGIVRLAAHLYREGIAPNLPPAAVAALWRPWRRMRLT